MVIEKSIAAAKAREGTIVLPEGHEPRVQSAAARLAAEGVCRVLLIGGEAPKCETLDFAKDLRREALIGDVVRKREKMSRTMAERLLSKPAYFAGALVAAGHADGMVAGADTPTRRIIEAGQMTVGLSEGVETPSSFFVMMLGSKSMIFADCALNVAPTAEQLADIAIASAKSAKSLLGEARVALLSYSTLGSGAGAEVDRVKEALAIAKERAPSLQIDGEYQADTALNRSTAEKKGAGGAVAGQANVLIFPSLEAGNIAYKLVQELAGAQAVGPFLQGFAKPICDLSRGATVNDIIAAAAVTLSMGQEAAPTQGLGLGMGAGLGQSSPAS
ncbi:MAG: phosphate acyltransferase [Pseudomonadota bacterium]